MPKINERVLKIYWSKKENDIMVQYPRRCDGHLINNHFSKMLKWGGIDGLHKGGLNYEPFNIVEELVKRGYDKTTIKFEIKLKDDIQL